MKIQSSHQYHFSLLGSVRVKAASKMLMIFTPWWMGHKGVTYYLNGLLPFPCKSVECEATCGVSLVDPSQEAGRKIYLCYSCYFLYLCLM